MALNKWATRVAIALSTPIILFASAITLMATFTNDRTAKVVGYDVADALYLLLGYPLTGIVNILATPSGLQDSDTWWALPLLNTLFVFQWIIWAQMIVLMGRACRLFWHRFVPVQVSPHVWPDRIVKADGRRFRLKTSPRVFLGSLSNAERRPR